MLLRKQYLDELKRWKDKDLIKVVTGIRRCGKSTLFDLYIEDLLNEGIDKSQKGDSDDFDYDERDIKLNLEDLTYVDLDDYMKLYNFILEKIEDTKKYYIFLDEIQNINMWQKAVDSLYLKKNLDIYITGSNAYLLSGELATLLSGRYIEIKMLPLSFSEYVEANDEKSVELLYRNYISLGSFPYTLNLDGIDDVDKYIKSIYDTILLKDVIARRKFPDMQMLQSVVNFMLDNIGNITSTNKIADTMTSNGRNISVHTVESYISALTEAFIFYKASRYDVKGKQYLKTGDKYYIADIGLRYFLLGRKQGDYGHILENIVYLELIRRGYEVYIGKVDEFEIDFVAINSKGIEYYQVAETTRGEQTLERELKPLNMIKDHFPKYILTMDLEAETTYNGIRKKYVLDWLLEKM